MTQKNIESNRKLAQDLEWRRKNTEKNQKLAQDPEWRRKNKEGARKRSQNPEWKRKNKEANQRKVKNPEYILKLKTASHRNCSQDPVWLLKIIETHRGGLWYGVVTYPDLPRYCELWEDVNPRVHAFFNYECCLCHAPENGRSHSGHHVFYVKNACCWQSEDGLYYTNLNAKDHPENDYYIGENPNYFVILCASCHAKVNGKFENRKKWADYFRKLIDEKYGGVCYTPKA
jgi:hypothetical protein